MRPMLIDDAVKARCAALVAHAETHRFTHVQLQRMALGLEPPCGDRPEFTLTIPVGYRAVFCLEEARAPEGLWLRHLSVSVPARGKYPHPACVEALLPLFGFQGGLRDCLVRDEEIGPEMHAINVLQEEKEGGHYRT